MSSQTQTQDPQIVRWDKPTPLTQEEAEARLHQEGYESYCWHDVSGSGYPRHKHQFDECLWILKGEIEFTIAEKSYLLGKGDRIYLPANLIHSASVRDRSGVTYVVGQKKMSPR